MELQENSEKSRVYDLKQGRLTSEDFNINPLETSENLRNINYYEQANLSMKNNITYANTYKKQLPYEIQNEQQDDKNIHKKFIQGMIKQSQILSKDQNQKLNFDENYMMNNEISQFSGNHKQMNYSFKGKKIDHSKLFKDQKIYNKYSRINATPSYNIMMRNSSNPETKQPQINSKKKQKRGLNKKMQSIIDQFKVYGSQRLQSEGQKQHQYYMPSINFQNLAPNAISNKIMQAQSQSIGFNNNNQVSLRLVNLPLPFQTAEYNQNPYIIDNQKYYLIKSASGNSRSQLKNQSQLFQDKIKVQKTKIDKYNHYLANLQHQTVTNFLLPINNSPKPYKFQILPGNNSQLIRRVIEQSQRSKYWVEMPNIASTHFHFRWAPISKQVNFDRLSYNFVQMINHFEFHNEISKKHELFKNVKQLLEDNNENVNNYMPLQFYLKVNMDKPQQSTKQQLEQFKQIFKLFEEFKSIFETGEKQLKLDQPSLQELIESGNVSFVSKYSKNHQNEERNSLILSQKQKDTEFIMPLCHFKGKNIWILKPTSLNRGKGIHVVSSFNKVKKLIRDYCRGKEQSSPQKDQAQQIQDQYLYQQQILLPQQQNIQHKPTNILKHNTFIIQKYIEDPMLVNKRKFDIRVWVLITQDMEAYFFKEGYLRLSGSEYSIKKENLDNDYIHLTNNAVQKNAPNYGSFEDGNQLSFKDFKQYLKQNYRDKLFERDILLKMKYYVALSLMSVKKKLNINKRKQCFEIFGYDFIIDNDCNVWLIEANTNPCIEESSALLKQLIPRMINDAFKLTLDVQFPNPQHQFVDNIHQNNLDQKLEKQQHPSLFDNKKRRKSQNSKSNNQPLLKSNIETFSVDGYHDNENMWQAYLKLIKIHREKIASLKGKGNQGQIYVQKPARILNSQRVLHIVNQHEMRLIKPEILEQAAKQRLSILKIANQ